VGLAYQIRKLICFYRDSTAGKALDMKYSFSFALGDHRSITGSALNELAYHLHNIRKCESTARKDDLTSLSGLSVIIRIVLPLYRGGRDAPSV